ncbi:hypothetical protein GEV02_02850 [Rugamonas sp. FT29W]|uniref:Abortive infection protein-like C-terminal domain-containing protein n=2 Tax=Rugamonas aquatica TaxID=2743357 RepID=A0A6A7MWL3_9BURK|nr:hypothetical protein [Rugamonas aquatica]
MLSLQRAIGSEFKADDWKEFGYESGQHEYIQGHDRLLRSLYFGDDDYRDCVFKALEFFASTDPAVIELLINHPKLTRHLITAIPEISAFVLMEAGNVQAAAPAGMSSEDVVVRALADAEHLLQLSGPVSTVDRLHTALHGYFRSLCAENALPVAEDASITALFKSLRTAHPILKDLGSYDKDLVRVLYGFANTIDAINSLRNNGSVAHPSEDLLGEPEAHLAANATRTIFNYIRVKVGH